MDTTPEPEPGPGHRPVAGTGALAAASVPRPYPIVLHLEAAPCLVVGAGPVAARRARGLLEAGAAVTVVAPSVGDEMRSLAAGGPGTCGALALEIRPYAPPEAAAYRLVVAATGDPEVDDRVAADGRAGGALVNRAGTPAVAPPQGASREGTVVLPAVHRVGTVTVAVSTDGGAPALARWLRDRVAADLEGAGIDVLAGLAAAVRADHRACTPGADRGGRRAGESAAWSAALDRVAPLVAGGRLDEARGLLDGLLADPGGEAAKSGPASSLGFPS